MSLYQPPPSDDTRAYTGHAGAEHEAETYPASQSSFSRRAAQDGTASAIPNRRLQYEPPQDQMQIQMQPQMQPQNDIDIHEEQVDHIHPELNHNNDATILTNRRSYPHPQEQNPQLEKGAPHHGHHGHHGHHLRPHERLHDARQIHRQHVREANPNYKAKDIRAHFVAVSGEFVGTFLFLWFSLAGTSYALNQPAETTNTVLVTYYISVIFGLSLLANVWVFYRISGGLFNPAVTVGLVISDQLPVVRGLLLIPSQILAAMCAAGLVKCMFPDSLLAVTRLTRGTSVAQGLFIEMFLTGMLVITVLMLAAEKSKDTFLAPVGIGLAFFAAELVGVPYTGGSLNPVRSFGPDVANTDFPGYHWIYWVGPLLGALIASGYHRLVKTLNYEEANPGQDSAVPID